MSYTGIHDFNELPISRGCECGKLKICTYIGGLVHIILYIVLMVWIPSVTPSDPLYTTLHDISVVVLILSSLGIVFIFTTFVGAFLQKKIFLLPWLIYSFTLMLVQISCIKLFRKEAIYPIEIFIRDVAYTVFCGLYWGIVLMLNITYSTTNQNVNYNRMDYESIS